MALSKQVTVRLFFNLLNRSFYVQVGDSIFIVRDKIVAAIQEKEDLEIRHVADIKEMQQISLKNNNAENG